MTHTSARKMVDNVPVCAPNGIVVRRDPKAGHDPKGVFTEIAILSENAIDVRN